MHGLLLREQLPETLYPYPFQTLMLNLPFQAYPVEVVVLLEHVSLDDLRMPGLARNPEPIRCPEVGAEVGRRCPPFDRELVEALHALVDIARDT